MDNCDINYGHLLRKNNPGGQTGAGRSAGSDSFACLKSSTNSLRKQLIYSDGHIVGQVVGDCFKKTIVGSKHLLRKPPAIAFSIDSLVHAQQAGATWADVFDRESGVHYTATLEHIWECGFELERGGFERQRALVLEGWTRYTGTHGGAQLSLFVA